MSTLISYLFLSLFVSFVCSLVESVLLTTPKSHLTVIKENKAWARSFLEYKNNIDRPLSAILSLNTVAHTIGAAGVGAEVIKIYGDSYLGIASAILTILILVITEIIPKTFGARYWKRIAKLTYHIIRLMLIIAYPLVIVSSFITKIISKQNSDKVTSREELAALADIGANEGVFSEKENKIIQNIIGLQKVKVTKIMTPRVVVTSVEENTTLKEFKQNKDFLNFSRIPIYSEQNEKINGYVYLQDILEDLSNQNNLNSQIKKYKRNVLTVPSNITLFNLWDQMMNKKEHIAIVIDEYGGLDGIVTMEDIIETLIGLEITDENDTIIDMQKYAKEKWKKKQNKKDILSRLN